MSEAVEIRPAVLEDCGSIGILAHNLGYPSTIETVKKRLSQIIQNNEHQVFVAGEIGGMLVGFIHIYQNFHIETDTSAEIGALVVSPEHRRLGIGRRLFNQAIEWSTDRNLRIIRCRNHAPDAESFAFFNNMNFRQLNPQIVFVYHLPT